MTTEAPPPQRWASIPDRDLKIRDQQLFVGPLKSSMNAVVNFCKRQQPYDAAIERWVVNRSIAYTTKWNVSPRQSMAEACVDLIAWQRRNADLKASVEVAIALEEHAKCK